jgi:membrane-bound lytic murein transglycosylase D
MNYIRLATIIWILVFFTGCQQAFQSSGTPVQGRDTDPTSLTSSGSKDARSEDAVSARRGSAGKKTSVTSSISTKSRLPISEAGAVEQIKIDHALELCTVAQEMWEAGRIEDALLFLDDAYAAILEIDAELSPEISQQKEDVRFMISRRILEIYASRQMVVAGSHDEIPITINEHVQYEIDRLTGPERRFFINSLERSSRFRPYIVEQLKAAGLPEELSWLPLIESGYQLRALSTARALGLWQFIPSTGNKFGLTRNEFIDERMDPEKSTLAAIAYLKELHNLFGDWTTVLAAYNCGEGRVLRTIRNQRINYLDNFWDLYPNLPKETARYVPRFLATLHIIQNLDKYGITVENPQHPIPYETVEVRKQVRLTDIAKTINVDTDELRALNPELRYDRLPPDTYQLKLPENKAGIFLASLDKIQPTYSAPQLVSHHKIQRGETLSSIATRYRTSVDAIARANNISRNHRIMAGNVLKIPGTASGSQAAPKAVASSSPKAVTSPAPKAVASAPKSAPKPQTPVQYKVQKGDSLWGIARKFSTTPKQIMANNNLSGSTLHVGQTLVIASPQKKAAVPAYLVKSGDSPFLIAQRHNMSLDRLLALNSLSKNCRIFPGQKLRVE